MEWRRDFQKQPGRVVDDIRLGDVIKDQDDEIFGGLNGDMDVRINRLGLEKKANPEDEPEIVAQSFDGDVHIGFNGFRNRVGRIDITSAGGGDFGVKFNKFVNAETDQ